MHRKGTARKIVEVSFFKCMCRQGPVFDVQGHHKVYGTSGGKMCGHAFFDDTAASVANLSLSFVEYTHNEAYVPRHAGSHNIER